MSPTAVFALAAILAIGQVRTPPRDTRARPSPPRPAGTARLSGVVVLAGETPSPVRRALVTITAAELPSPLSTVTDDDGRFTLGDLPAGRFTVTAERKPFLTFSYGAARSGEAGTSIAVAAGQHAADLRIVLVRGAVLSGLIAEANGEPMPGAQVTVIGAGSTIVGSTVTDDRGMYRVFGLPPGTYTISAVAPPRRAWTGQNAVMREQEVDASLRELQQQRAGGRPVTGGVSSIPPGDPTEATRYFVFAKTFYPGTLLAADAMAITVAAGEERAGLDFVMAVVPNGQP